MKHLLATYFLYVQDPGAGIRRLLERRSFRQACLGYFVAALSWVLFFNVGDQLSVFSLLFKLGLVFVAEVTAGYFVAALSGLFLDLRYVKVSSAQLFVLVGSTGFLNALLIACALISAAFAAAHLGWLMPLVVLGLFILKLVYLVRGLQYVWNVTVGDGVGAWLFGLIPVCVAFSLAGIFFIWFLVVLF